MVRVPVYEYRCQKCAAKFQVLVGMVAGPEEEKCPKCGSTEVGRLISRFMKGRTEDARVDELADRLEIYGEPDSSSEARALMREMGKAMDEDSADEMEEMFEADMEGNLDEEE